MPIVNLKGQRFGKLEVGFREGSDAAGYATWQCKCDCGNSVVVRGEALRNGRQTSCGCKRESFFAK